MRIEPLFNQVALKKLTNQKTAGGIYIPETSDMQVWEVTAVGPGTRDQFGNWQEVTVKIGDQVLVDSRVSKNTVRIGDDAFVILHDHHLLCRVVKE